MAAAGGAAAGAPKARSAPRPTDAADAAPGGEDPPPPQPDQPLRHGSSGIDDVPDPARLKELLYRCAGLPYMPNGASPLTHGNTAGGQHTRETGLSHKQCTPQTRAVLCAGPRPSACTRSSEPTPRPAPLPLPTRPRPRPRRPSPRARPSSAPRAPVRGLSVHTPRSLERRSQRRSGSTERGTSWPSDCGTKRLRFPAS
jgi:hypothetical protein